MLSYAKISLKMIIFIIGMNTCLASFYKEHEKGWFWYEDPTREEREEKEEDEKKLPISKEEQKPLSSTEQINIYKKQLEETKAKALINPTFENVQNYMIAQKDMVDRSLKFSKSWEKVLLQTPHLNAEIKNPTSQYLTHVQYDEQIKKEDHLLKQASKQYGLFLFVSNGCAYCKAFAPIVKSFSDQYGFHVFVVSINGPVGEEITHLFENFKMNNGMAESFGIEQAPALMAYNGKTQDVIPVSYGATSMDTLKHNFVTLLQG